MLNWLFLLEVLDIVIPSTGVMLYPLCFQEICIGKSPLKTVQVTDVYSSASTESSLNSKGEICGGTVRKDLIGDKKNW